MKLRTLLAAIALTVLVDSTVRAQAPRASRPRPAPQTPPQTLPRSIEEMLWWLPPDTETLEVTQPGAASTTEGFVEPEDGVYPGPTFAETLDRYLRDVPIKALVEGSRRFRPAKGLGSALYEGVTIARLERPLDDGGSRLMTDLRSRAQKADRFEDLEILEFREQLEDDMWTFSIAVPSGDLLLIATDRAYLEELLRRRTTKARARAFPADLPEWQWVDVKAPFWALRHYRRDAPDFTSPFAEGRLVDVVDAAATGVTVHLSADQRTFVAHYISKGAKAEAFARAIWNHPEDDVSPTFRRVGNAIEVRLVSDDEDVLAMFAFYTMAALGHAVDV